MALGRDNRTIKMATDDVWYPTSQSPNVPISRYSYFLYSSGTPVQVPVILLRRSS